MRTCLVFLFLILLRHIAYAQTVNGVSGTVVISDGIPLPQVNISIKHSNQGTTTDHDGNYQLGANIGDTLLFTYLGLQSYEIPILEIPSVIDVQMIEIETELDELKVKARPIRTQAQLLREYPTNKNLIKSSLWGILDQRIMSGSIRIIKGNELINIGYDFLESLKNLVPGMSVSRDGGGVKVLLPRTFGNAFAIFDVDGMILRVPPPIMSSEIDRVAILMGNSGNMRYGPQGIGGVIIVNTKAQTEMDERGVDRTFEKKTLLDSMIVESAAFDDFMPFISEYLQPYRRIRSRKKALSIYENQKDNFRNDPFYYIDLYHYFSLKWDQETQSIHNEIIERFSNNPLALKALAYIEEQRRNRDHALELYLQILDLDPFRAQAHRDVALAYALSGDDKNALLRYNWIKESSTYLTQRPFDPYGIDYLMTTEMLNVLQRQDESFMDSLHTPEISGGTRVVLDWNHPNATFDMKIINPDGYYDDWQNVEKTDSSSSNTRYLSKQFFLDSEVTGKWILNMQYLGNGTDDPTYLKLTVFYDYGLPEQRSEVQVFRLTEPQSKFKLADIWQP